MNAAPAPPAGEPVAFPVHRNTLLDPPEALADLRRRCPVARVRMANGEPVWLVTGWSRVRAALTDDRLSSAHARSTSPAATRPTPDAVRIPPGLFIAMDRPEHTRYRRMLAPSFTVRAVRRLAPYVERVVGEHLDALLRTRPADFVARLAVPVPALVVGELLGVPAADRAEFGHLSATLLTVNDGSVRGYLAELIRRRRREPADDLVGRLLAAGMRPDELATVCAMLLTAGHETVTGMLALGLLTLLDPPTRYAGLVADPDRAGAVAEELLRYLTVIQFGVFRVARTDLVLGGVPIPRGDTVVASLAAANRDPAHADRPDTLRWDRGAGHVAFGYGTHHCLGAHLARLQLTVALRALARRVPTLRLAVPPATLRPNTEHPIYGIRELPVTH